MLKQNNGNQQQLLQWINEASFAVTDISLYLDTHPDDTEALAFFNHYSEERQKALDLYADSYAPLTLDLVRQDGDHWIWSSDPWPWEGGYC